MRRWGLRLTFLVLAVGASGAWLVLLSPVLDVDRIDVRGARTVAGGDVRKASGVGAGEPLLLVDTGAATRRIEAIPRIAEAHVETELGGRVSVRVVERTAVAWAPTASGPVALLDASGLVIDRVATAPEGLPEVAGLVPVPPPGARVAPAGAPGVLVALPEVLRGRVVRVVAVGSEVTLVLGDGPEVRLGPPRDVRAKGEAALAVVAATEAVGRPVAYVDVRVPATPATG